MRFVLIMVRLTWPISRTTVWGGVAADLCAVDVDWETDRKRMMWTMGDVVYERLPQSRWREEYKEEAVKTMDAMKLGGKQGD